MSASWADDSENGPIVSLPAFPVQLPAGKEPGTYHFSEPVYVKFSQQSEFPVDYVVEDYSHKEVFRTPIKSGSPVVVGCDLKPGSYQACYRMKGRAKEDYWDESGSEFFIFGNGVRGFGSGWLSYFSAPAYSGPYGNSSTIFRRKIELLEPLPKATIKADSIVLRWKAIPHVDTYTVCIWPIQHPDHPDSIYAGDRQSLLVKGTHTSLPVGFRDKGWYIKAGEAIGWVVYDGDMEEGHDGHIARGESVFSTAGAEQEFAQTGQESFMCDEAIETRLGLLLQQPYIPSPDPIQDYVIIVGIGAQSPALQAGLQPGERIASFDGKPVSTLKQFHDDLAAVPAGQTVTLGIDYDERNPVKPLTWPCSMVAR